MLLMKLAVVKPLTAKEVVNAEKSKETNGLHTIGQQMVYTNFNKW